MRERPSGVTLLALLAWFNGLWALCIGVFALGAFDIGALSNALTLDTEGFGLASLYNLVWGLASFLLAFGLWQRNNWGRIGTILVQAINLLYVVITLFTGDTVNWLSAVISAIILGYLFLPRIRATFN